MATLTITPGYTWVDGEVETATKFNLAGAPTLAAGQSYSFASGTSGAPSISFNSEATLGFYRASAGNASFVGGMLTAAANFAVTGTGVADSNIYLASDGTTAGQFMGGGALMATNAGGQAVSINRNGSDGNAVVFYRSGAVVGSISVTTSATAFNTSSDLRLKKDIRDISDAGAIVDAFRPRRFRFIADDAERDGFIAQELELVYAPAVTRGDKPSDMWSVDHSKLVPVLVAEVQSLRRRVSQLEAA
jgi:hypothetical protein